jgi:hypothetical protein
VPCDIREAEIAADIAVGQLFVIDAEEVQEGAYSCVRYMT